MHFADTIRRHDRIVLQFSGGKDSLACLYLLQPFWPKINVAWVNTGDAFPETIEQMRAIREMVPNFMEIRSNVRAQQDAYGYPTDVLPVRNHPTVMKLIHPQPRPFLQSCFACCRDNLWTPMQNYVEALGATLIIRGQRKDEVQHSPVRSGDVIDGVEFLFPIEDWTSEGVRSYLGERLPEHYKYMDTGLDCMHCTAHLFENIGKRRYMRERHPVAHSVVSQRLAVIRSEVAKDMIWIEEAINA